MNYLPLKRLKNGIIDPTYKIPNMNLEIVFLKMQLNVLEVKEFCVREDREAYHGYFSLKKIKKQLNFTW